MIKIMLKILKNNWILCNYSKDLLLYKCPECGYHYTYPYDSCPGCKNDMRGEVIDESLYL